MLLCHPDSFPSPENGSQAMSLFTKFISEESPVFEALSGL